MNLDEIIEQLTETILHEAMDTDEIAGMSCQQFFALQHQQKREFLRQKYQEGMRFHGLTDHEHDELMWNVLFFINAEVKPQVKQILKGMGLSRGKPEGWADTVASRINSKKTGRTLREQESHPVITDLREALMYSQSHKGAIQSATYIGKAELLFTGSQTARRLKRLEKQMTEQAQRVQRLELEAAEAKARLSSLEDWQEKAEALDAAGNSHGAIARILGRPRTTISSHLAKKRRDN